MASTSDSHFPQPSDFDFPMAGVWDPFARATGASTPVARQGGGLLNLTYEEMGRRGLLPGVEMVEEPSVSGAPYNQYFASETKARLGWGLLQAIRGTDRPFPPDLPPQRRIPGQGTGLGAVPGL